MNKFRERKTWIVFIAVLLLFAACKGESPTAPPPGGGIPPGGTTPPTGVNVVLSVSNASPVVDSTVTITATVTQNNVPVPNGTAVEFSTTGGVLDGNGTSVIKTTTGGIATVTLTRGTVGTVTVTAVVNNVIRTTGVNFVARPITPQPPNTTPTITAVTPNIGRPSGGETIRISGTNFTAPVRVLFRYAGLATPVEAFVVSVTPTLIEAITPAVNLGAGQELITDIIVLTQAGTQNENRAELAGAFTFRNEQLTPIISTVTPNSGPVTGGTRVSIFGEGFQEPVQVLFGTAEARVLNVKFRELLVETPAGRDTSPDGSGPVLGPVAVSVRNINSNQAASLAAGFNYKNAIQVIAVGPGGAIAGFGGTRVTIDGNGFVPPVVVVVRTAEGDISLQPISVSGTRIVAIAPAILPSNCEDLIGDLIVTNVVNGDQATGPPFTFFVPEPIIVNVNPSTVTAGGNVVVTVANVTPGAARITLGERSVFPSASTFDETTRTATFTVAVPTNLEFPSIACTNAGVPGERLGPLSIDVGYENVATSCEDTATEALTVNPPDTSCVVPPPPVLSVSPAGVACAVVPNTVAAGTITGQTTITVSNTAAAGSQDLRVTSVGVTNPVNGTFTVAPLVATIPAGSSQNFTVTVDPGVAGPFTADVSFTTNAGNDTVCITGNGT
jgi:IPT/TIG domain